MSLKGPDCDKWVNEESALSQKWFKERTAVNHQQGHWWPMLIDAGWNQRLAHAHMPPTMGTPEQ